MVQTIGPAVGGKGQIGFKEESKWGYPVSPPNKFIEFTSESIVSEYTNLVSDAVRADRAVHKQRIGAESAGGDMNFEIAPEGFGTLFKHALGQRRTKRKDVAFILVYSGSDTVFLMHFGEAEFACFHVLGWRLPEFIFDTYTLITQLRARPAKKFHNIH